MVKKNRSSTVNSQTTTNMITNILNRIRGRCEPHAEAVIISCYFNPMNSPYRRRAFEQWYDKIKHLNHRVVECVIGDAEPHLPESEHITRLHTPSLLWHKESLLNGIVKSLPKRFKYVFWVDADVLFTNRRWLVDGCKQLQSNKIIQPFEWCVHLERDEVKPSFDMDKHRTLGDPTHKMMWRSFCANWSDCRGNANSGNYDRHGHVGFAWGARREVLDKLPLYDRALIGGADHIIAHAAAGQIPSGCIEKAFHEDIEAVNDWSRQFYSLVRGQIGYVKGDLYHLWHGDINKRQYLKRIQDFTGTTKGIKQRDKHGLHVATPQEQRYVRGYFEHREVNNGDDGFLNSMMLGYVTDSTMMGWALGGSLPGAMIGASLHDHSQPEHHHAAAEYTPPEFMDPSSPPPPVSEAPKGESDWQSSGADVDPPTQAQSQAGTSENFS